MKKIIACIIIGVAIILSGIYCGVSWFQKAHRESHIVGSLTVDNSYTQDTFKFSTAEHPIVFYHDDYNATDFWYFEEELEKVPTFDGDKKQYEVMLNQYLILEPTVLFRAVSFRVPIVFKDLDASVMCDTYFDVVVKFFVDKTKFEISVTGDENRQFVEHYIQANGFELFIMEVKK